MPLKKPRRPPDDYLPTPPYQLNFNDGPPGDEIGAGVQNVVNQSRIADMEFEKFLDRSLPVIPFKARPGYFLTLCAELAAIRMFLFIFVENMGTEAKTAGLVMDVLYASMIAWGLKCWIVTDWFVYRWTMLGRLGLILGALAVSVTVFGGDKAWDGVFEPPTMSHALGGFAVVEAALLIAASSWALYSHQAVMGFLAHPIKTIKELINGWKRER